jgi:hypothetical protein
MYKQTKNPPKKTQKNKNPKKPTGLFFFLKPGFFPTLPMLGSCPEADELEPRHHGADKHRKDVRQ